MVIIDEEKCIGCGKCAKDCIARSIRIRDGKARAREGCLLCGHCVSICPKGAVSISDYEEQPCAAGNGTITPDQILELIRSRRSIRRYTDSPVTQEELEKLIQAGSHTATAKNMQEIGYVFVQEGLDRLRELVFDGMEHYVEEHAHQSETKLLKRFLKGRKGNAEDEMLFRNAPSVLFLTGDYPLDAGLAAQNIELTAVSMGLGVLFNGYLTGICNMLPQVRKYLGIENRKIALCMLVGHPDVQYVRTAPRKKPDVTIL